MSPLHLAASVDIGSHSSILLVAQREALEDRVRLVPLVQKVEVVRLGEDLHAGGPVKSATLAQLEEVLTGFRRTLHRLGAPLEAVAMTEAVRKAPNQEEIIALAEKALWKTPRVIPGEEEAQLAWKGVAGEHGTQITILDVGGGSSEFCNGKDRLSIPIGALRLQKEFGVIPGPDFKKWAKETLKPVELKPFGKHPLYLVGGSAVAFGMFHLGLSAFDAKQIEGMMVTRDELDRGIQRLTDLSKELRTQLPGLEGGRSEVIICGLSWIRALLEKSKREEFRISTLGLRFGILQP